MTDKEPDKKLAEINRKNVQKNTLQYLEKYLNPDRTWEKEVTPKQRLYQIRYANVNWDVVSDHIKGMDYHNFLKTPYWKAIAAHTKYKAGYRCQLCNSFDDLITHHRDYRIHGFEHARMQDLIVLCDGCHNKFHDHPSGWNLSTIVAIMILSIVFVYFLMEDINIASIYSLEMKIWGIF